MNRFPASLAVSNFLQPSSTVVRASQVRSVGGFTPDREMQHIEDYDLWIRLAQAGSKFAFINKNLTKYRKHPDAATSNIRRMEELHERLITRHATFFINGQRQILWVAMRDNSIIRQAFKKPIRTLFQKLLKR